MELKNLEKEIENIKERNKKVELDKSWETSWTRKICIMILTYIVVDLGQVFRHIFLRIFINYSSFAGAVDINIKANL